MLELNTTEKPYQCEYRPKSKCLICVIGIIQNSMYKSELKHCEYNHKYFTHKGDLTKHIRTHKEEKHCVSAAINVLLSRVPSNYIKELT